MRPLPPNHRLLQAEPIGQFHTVQRSCYTGYLWLVRRLSAQRARQHLLTPGPRTVTVREVIRPKQSFVIDMIDHFERNPVVLKCRVDVVTEIFARQFR